jgi:hypothetical protein
MSEQRKGLGLLRWLFGLGAAKTAEPAVESIHREPARKAETEDASKKGTQLHGAKTRRAAKAKARRAET